MCKLFVLLAGLTSQLALAESPKDICRVVGAWNSDKGIECNQAIKRCDTYDAKAFRICNDMVFWDFKYVPACLSAVCNSTFTETQVRGCAAEAIFDFHSAVSCLETAGT
jgi:hypothetical protein